MITVEVRWSNVPVPEVHLGAIAGGLLLHRLRPMRIRPRPGTGWTLFAAGALVVAWAVRTAGTTRLTDPDRLVTTGPYARSRHPMYGGWTAMLAGLGFVTGIGWILALVPPAVMLADREARREEARLEQAFGPAYAAYRERTRRWL